MMGITAYFKPTNFCSIDCDHCYLTKDVRVNKTIMTEEILVSSANLIADLLRREGHKSAHIVWHGGEPLMLTPEWYQWAINIIDSVLGKDMYSQSIQTSLLPYSSKWSGLIKERFSGFVGSSIDFSQRKIKSNTSTYVDAWLKKVQHARNDGIFVIPGMVPTKMEVGKGRDLVRWFFDHGFSHFNIERYSHFGESSIYVPTNRDHAKFLIEVFDSTLELLVGGFEAPKINVVSSAINGILFSLPGDRWGTACQREFIVIEPDGSLNTCPDRTSHEPSFSNVSGGAEDFMRSTKRRDWIRVQNISHKKDHCITCEYNIWCKSGCPITKNGPSEGEVECSGYKTYLNHVKSVMENNSIKSLLLNYVSS